MAKIPTTLPKALRGASKLEKVSPQYLFKSRWQVPLLFLPPVQILKFGNVECCISTSVWVLPTPKSGLNLHFNVLNAEKLKKGKKQEICNES